MHALPGVPKQSRRPEEQRILFYFILGEPFTIIVIMRQYVFPIIAWLGCLGMVPADAQAVFPGAIRVNQVGFSPGQPKLAVSVAVTHGPFAVVDLVHGDTAWKGVLEPAVTDPYTGTATAVADFSKCSRPGKYAVVVPGERPSPAFVIAPGALHSLAVGSLKAYYFLRCSESLSPAFAGKWARPAGHPDTAVYIHPSAASPDRPAGSIFRSPGGWYDAGDYNKYIVNCGITMQTLLSAYEDFPAHFDTLRTGIPETDASVPDILEESLWNLRWMLTMQDPADGGVYHKLTTARFDGMEMPVRDHARRYVVMKTTAATLDFAAVMAEAARVFTRFPRAIPGFGDSCRRAALSAWDWATAHPHIVYDQEAMNKKYQPEVTTGTYGDRRMEDEWGWAAAELWSLTRAKRFLKACRTHLSDTLSVPSWNQVTLLGYEALLRTEKKDGPDRKRFLAFAESLLARIRPAYRMVMGGAARDFVWGSNAVAANQGIVLVKAYLLSGDRRFLAAAEGNLDYLLGRNATGYCFVTGFGSRSPLHPHHRPSIADGVDAPVPGLLVGGPNPGQQDSQSSYPSHIAELSYTDNDQAYAANEIAINWNAPLVYLANAIAVLSREK